jgi:hypothetical protein
VLRVAAGFVVFSVMAGFVIRRRGGRTPWALTLALGVAVTLAAISAGGWLISVKNPPPPEPRGVGVLVWRPDGRAATGSGNNLTLTSALHVTSCGRPVEVRLTITPTVEFWQARWRALEHGAVVGVAIPDTGLTEVHVTQETDGLQGLVDPGFELHGATALTAPRVSEVDGADTTLVEFDVPDWGRNNLPVSVLFKANWTSDSSPLGTCYVTAPALIGLPTALSAAEIAGRAAPAGADIPGTTSALVLTSHGDEPRTAYYNERYELTRGVTAMTLTNLALDENRTLPGPDSNLNGSHAWTCAGSVAKTVGFVASLGRDDPPTDLAIPPDNGNGFSASQARLSDILGRRTCASFTAVEQSGLGTSRDLVLIGIGALFSVGLEIAMGAYRRRHPEAVVSVPGRDA